MKYKYIFILMSTFLAQKLLASPNDSIKARYYHDKAYELGIYHINYQTYMDSLLMLQPTNAYYWQQKGMPLLKANKIGIGMAYIDSAVKYKSSYIDYRAFMKCIFARDYAGAIVDFNESIKQKGHSFIMDHSFEFYMAISYLQMNQIRKADSLLDESMKFYTDRKSSPHYLELFYKGIVQIEDCNLRLALKTFDEVLKQYPQLPDAYFYKAYINEILGELSNEDILKQYQTGLDYLVNGYAINEDSSIYMDYPFQVRRSKFDYTIRRLKKSVK